MPTYVCSTSENLLDRNQKQELAKAIGHRHSESTGAPPFFVQVIFQESSKSQTFLGGEPVSDHIWIRGDIRAASTPAHRAGLMLNILKDAARLTK